MWFMTYMDSKLGRLCLAEDGIGLTEVSFERKKKSEARLKRERSEERREQETPLLLEAKRQLSEYLEGARTDFDLPLSLLGTEFQKKVWTTLRTIPYGETRTYGQIAGMVGNVKACRAVGMANHNNPIAVIVPCHRVIGADHSLVGYGGGLDIKEMLLSLESRSRG